MTTTHSSQMLSSKLTVPSVMATCQPPSAVRVLTAAIFGPSAIRRSSSRVVQHQATSFREVEEEEGETRDTGDSENDDDVVMGWTRGKGTAVLDQDPPETVPDSCNKERGTSTVERQARREKEKRGTLKKERSWCQAQVLCTMQCA